MRRIERLRQTSDALVQTAKNVKILSALSWPQSAADTFLESWKKGNPEYPKPPLPKPCSLQTKEALDAIIQTSDTEDPAQRWLARTASSYRQAANLLEQVGTPAFHQTSRNIYGGPRGNLRGSTLSHRAAADQLLLNTESLGRNRDGPQRKSAISRQRTLQMHFEQNGRDQIRPGETPKVATRGGRLR